MGKHYWIREEDRCCFRSSVIRRGHVLEEMVEYVVLAQPIGVDLKFVGGLPHYWFTCITELIHAAL